jgi:hypothetical protein
MVIAELERTVGQKHANSTNPKAYHIPLQKKVCTTAVNNGAQVAAPLPNGPKFVDELGAQRAKTLRLKVETTESYRQRVKHMDRSVFDEGLGVIMAVHQCGDGHVCDVVWDNGKVLQGYCVGYRQMFDLQFVSESRLNSGQETPERRGSISLSRSFQFDKQESFSKTKSSSPTDESKKLGKLSESTSSSSLEEQEIDKADIKVKFRLVDLHVTH